MAVEEDGCPVSSTGSTGGGGNDNVEFRNGSAADNRNDVDNVCRTGNGNGGTGDTDSGSGGTGSDGNRDRNGGGEGGGGPQTDYDHIRLESRETVEGVRPGCNTLGRTSTGQTFVNKIKQMCSSITLEPMLFLKMIAEGNFGVVADTLEIDRVCRVNLNYTVEDCKNMDDGNHADVQAAVQIYQNNFNNYQALLASIIPLVVVLFIGSLSDRYGRKPPMIAVLLGFVQLGVMYILVAIRDDWPVEVLLLGSLGLSSTGTWVVFNMVVYSYLADITSSERRTKRMAILDFCWYVGSPLGTLLGGWLYKLAGYVAVFATSTILWSICSIYTLVIVKESLQVRQLSDEQKKNVKCSPLRPVISILRTGFKSRPGNGRCHIIVLVCLKLAIFLVQGHQVYPWSRKMLQWGPTEYSTWSSIDSVVHQVGMVLWVGLAERSGMHDCSTLLGGIFSIMLWSILLSFITQPQFWWVVIVASLVGMLEGSMEPSVRSMITSVAGSSESGKILALMGLLEAAWLSVDSTIFTAIYNSSIETFPQINFVVQASIAAILIPTTLLLKRSMKKHLQPAVKQL